MGRFVAFALLALLVHPQAWGRERQTELHHGSSEVLTTLKVASPDQQPNADANQARSGNERGTENVPLVVKVIRGEKSKEEVDQENAEQRRKVESDQRMLDLTDSLTKYTGLLFLATTALVIITGFLVYVGFRQVRDSQRSIIASEVAAKAARASAEALPDLERAYVFVEVSLGVPNVIVRDPESKDDGFICAIVIKATNHGRTPAIFTGIHVWSRIYETVPFELPDFVRGLGFLQDGRVIGAGRYHIETDSLKVTTKDWEDITSYNSMIVCCGVVEYRDVLRRKQETGFCWQVAYDNSDSRIIMSSGTPLNYTKQKD